MCLSNIYREQDHTLLMENTSRIDIDGDTIRLRDLFGDVREIRGAIVSADLEQNEVVIRCSEN
ncbi:MAG: CooT family nickel-binding protein [Eubacterium sp.]|nr:CooT family nickel-binding protein [Eubacterium sp.]MBQ9320919.1 CooT family nickel-binding protein [Eubacterium sp.]